MSVKKNYPIPGRPGFRITKDGEVLGKRGRALKHRRGNGGYVTVTIGPRQVTVGRLLCEAFHGPRPRKKNSCVLYLGGPDSCHVDDVRWGTRMESHQ